MTTAPSAMSQLTSPEASIADAAAEACFEQLCAQGSAHGFALPAALKARAAADLRDPKQVQAAQSLVTLVVQTAHASPADDALLLGIAALSSAVLSLDAALRGGKRTAKLRRRLLPVLEGCLLSASMLLVREQDGEVGGGPQPQDDLIALALEVALHSPSLEAASHATSLLAACARERGGALPLLAPLAYALHAYCMPTARPLHVQVCPASSDCGPASTGPMGCAPSSSTRRQRGKASKWATSTTATSEAQAAAARVATTAVVSRVEAARVQAAALRC